MVRLTDDQFDAELCERADQIVRQILSIGPQEGQGRVDIIELFLQGRVVYMCGGDARLEKCVTEYLREAHSQARRALEGPEPEKASGAPIPMPTNVANDGGASWSDRMQIGNKNGDIGSWGHWPPEWRPKRRR